ncbi:MAG TPA: hypothetical protein VK986_15340 [Tepidisphaeraceae bacterium]|nr:hypothetical protein [Tepidisphaeraceae bacterium]
MGDSGERSVHDNVVYAYAVDCEGARVVLHTEFQDREPREWTDVVFRGVVGHHFQYALAGNVLCDVVEEELDAFVQDNARLLAQSWRHGWPEVEYRGELGRLPEVLRERHVRAYRVQASHGLGGWVLAEGCERVGREARAGV